MLNKKYLIIITVLLAGLSNLYSQGGSNYSIFGIGDVSVNNSAYFNGLGGTSVGVKSDKQINMLNPALLAPLKTTRLQTGYLFNQNYVSSESSSLFQNNGKVNGLNAVFALDTSMDIAVTFGLNPYSSVNYYISNPVSVTLDTNETYTGRANYLGLGGLSELQFGIAGKVFKDFYLGLIASYKFGKIQTINTVTIYDQYSFYSTSEKINKMSGAGLKMGMYYEPITNLGIGAFYNHNFKMTNDLEYKYGSQLLYDTSITSSGEIELPSSFGVGASYKSGKFLFAMDYLNQDFSNFDLNKSSKFTYQPLTQISFGFSRLGNPGFTAEYLDKITYNFGFGYKSLYYKVGEDLISDKYLSIGLELPIAGNSLINTTFVFGTRGTTNNKLVQEYYGKLYIDFSIGETWFKPFIREY